MKLIKRTLQLLLCLLLLGVGIIYYATKVEPYTLTVKKHQLGNEGNQVVRIVQISDTHISEAYSEEPLDKLAKKINNQKADIIIFTGDLYENFAQYGEKDMVIQFLSDLEATYGKFGVWGNRDYGGGAKRHYAEIMAAGGFQLLKNDSAVVELSSGKTVCLVGVDDAILGKPDISQEVMQADEYDYKILITHEPDVADQYATHGFPLVLSGHSHGGQVRLPFIELYRTSLAEKYIRGFYDLDSEGQTKLYVNQGIGTTHYTVRFGVPPEITVFDIGV